MKKVALLLVLFILCSFAMAGCADKGITTEDFDKDPQKMLEASIDYEQLLGIDNDIVKAINTGKIKAPDSSKLTISMDLATISGDDTLPDLDITLSGAQNKTDIDIDFAVGEVATDARLYIDGDMLALESQSLLGGAYAIKFDDLSTFIEKFDNSELAKALNLPKGTAAAFCEQCGINDEYIAGVKAAWENMEAKGDLTALVERMTKSAVPEFTPAVEETVDINGTQTAVITSTTHVDEELYANIMGEYFGWTEEIIVSLKDLTNVLIPEVIKQQAGIDINSSFDGVMNEYNGALQNVMSEMTMNASVKYYLEKATGKLIRMDYDYDYQVSGMPMKYLLTVDMTDGFKIGGTLTVDARTIDMNMDIVHAEDGNCKSWTMNINQSEPDKEPVNAQIALTLDKENGTYRITVVDVEELVINGTYKAEKNAFEMSVDTIEAMGESTEIGITIAYAENVEISAPEYKELLTLTQDELYALIGRISTLAMSFVPQPDYGYEDEYYDDEYYDDEFYYMDDDYMNYVD